MRVIQIFIFSLILTLPLDCLAASNPPDFRVALSVSADESIKGRIESYISRELRALGDVTQTKENSEYDIGIVALKSFSKSGYQTGIVLSITIHYKFDNQFISFSFKEESMEIGLELTSGLYFYPDHWLRIGATEDLKSICSGIVADFDSQILQERRETYQRMLDAINKRNSSVNN